LEKHNIFVRKVSEYGLADCLRITIGLEEENIFLIKIINDFMKNN
jgi:histidinol-phosphate/aromatic aminotransferase/cobyric acid decarboxylase-like protein